MRSKRTTSVDQERQLVDGSPAAGGTNPLPPEAAQGGQPRHSVTLAGRMLSWSGNLLAICVIVILGLTFGKQVLQWWHDDPAALSIVANDPHRELEGLANLNLPHLLEFGDLPLSFERRTFVGDEQATLSQLRNSCRTLVTKTDQRSAIPVSASFLRRLETLEPVEEGRSWRIVQNGGPVITVVALRMSPPTTTGDANVTRQKAESVVSWGLGLRAPQTTATEEAASQNRWTLFTCSGRSHKVDSDLDLSQPIPPGSQRTLAVRVQNGGALIGFTGPRTASLSKQFFDQSFDERGWSREANWSQIGTSWHARFRKPESGACDIQIFDNADGETSGILTITSAAQSSEN